MPRAERRIRAEVGIAEAALADGRPRHRQVDMLDLPREGG